LAYVASEKKDVTGEAAEAAAVARANRARLDDLAGRLDRLAPAGGASPQDPAVENGTVAEPRSSQLKPRVARREWTALVADARQNLLERGMDPDAVDLDRLLDPDEVERINRRYQGGFSIRADLDPYDIIAAIAAGLTAALVDALIVRIPADTQWWGYGEKLTGSPLTKALRRLAVDSDNALGGWAKVAYDRVTQLEEPVAGFWPKTHRVQSFGHDPLLGLVMGTIDIMKGQMTVVARGGDVKVLGTPTEPVPDVFVAFAKQIVHLLSDAPTECGLPLPGWVGLVAVQGGSIGPNQESFGDVARRMYLNGYDSWHLLTMMSSVAALQLVLRGYWGLRSSVDQDWSRSTEIQAQVAGSSSTTDHPRFAAMALAANGVAAAANLGKIVGWGGNPLALNYAQWVAFLRSFYTWADGRMKTPGGVVDAQVRANAMALDEGWISLDYTDPAFPTPPAPEG
jgi:hypothetical protein